MHPEQTWAKTQTLAGSVAFAAPFWVDLLREVDFVAASVASICGAIITVHGAWRCIKHWRGK